MATDCSNSNSRLGVNKTSGKITKKTNAVPRPAPRIYKIHPSSFRNLVQELTGKEDFQPKAESPPPLKPQPSVSFNGRLQRFAPPPLDSSGGKSDGGIKFDIFSLSPIPILSPGIFSPVTSFTPMEWRWAEETVTPNLEYNKLAQNFLDQAEKSSEEPNFLDSPTAFRQDSNTRPVVSRCGSLSPTFVLPSPTSFAGFDLGTM